MKKVVALMLALAMCLALVPAFADAAPIKVGVLVPVMTHGWVSGITYQAEAYAKELEAAGKIEYRLTTSSNAEEMTTAEIFEALKISDELTPALYGRTKELFELSDFVKFAKHRASDEENARAVPVAAEFVTATYQSQMDSQAAEEGGDGQ